MSPYLRRFRLHTAGFSCVLAVIAASGPAQALAASPKSARPTFTVPASARVHGNSNGSTPSTTTQASTAPANTTPANTTPGTTAPTSTAPAVALPPASGATTPGASAPTTSTPSTGVPTGATPGAAASNGAAHQKAAAGNTRLSAGALALIVLGALLILGCLSWAIARQLALEPRWTVSLMHSLREAGYRGSATWAEFADWSRLGR
jgi:hypothetical protein